MITALCGGVGGAKLALGLYRTLPPGELTVIVNTADDLDLWGLHISPDLDTVIYTLAGIARRDVGWGIEGDTFEALAMLERYGLPAWFQVGDRDLATDIMRTETLRRGERLTEVAGRMVDALGVSAQILPMTDAPVATKLLVYGEWIHFQEYFVRRRHADPVEEVRYEGVGKAGATEEVLDAIETAEVVVLVNSNPVLSILPILEVSGINEALIASSATTVAVSPIVGGDAVSGPAGDLMRLIEQPATALGVARAYLGIIDGIVIDRQDDGLAGDIGALGLGVRCADTIMRSEDDRIRLAGEVLSFARSLA
jgi:LPPG:FO 2-phospho-L-lactate transferase